MPALPKQDIVKCPCGRNLPKNARWSHANSCAKAREAGWEHSPERRAPCECGCGMEAVAYGVKAPRFVNFRHYDKWRREQPGKKEQHTQATARWRRRSAVRVPRLREEAREQHEKDAMVPLQRTHEEILAQIAALPPVKWDADRILAEILSWKVE